MSGLVCLFHTRPRVSQIAMTLLCLLFFPIHAGFGQSPDNCSSKLKQAEIKFSDGFFDDVIPLLGGCEKNGGLSSEERFRVNILLSNTFFVLGQVELATNAIRTILSLSPNWTPDPNRVTPPYVQMVEQTKAQMRAEADALKAKEGQPEPEQKTILREDESDDFPQAWHYVVGGVALSGTLYFLLNPNTSVIPRDIPPFLPGPPNLP